MRFNFVNRTLKATNCLLSIAGLVAALPVLLCVPAEAQPAGWTWYAGQGTPSKEAEWGTRGVPSPANSPGARSDSVTWTDSSGNRWLFGGSLSQVNGDSGVCNDVWKYDAGLNQWVWLKGKNFPNFIGVYGTQGVAAEGNNPGARAGAAHWLDATGKLWVFGGIGYDITGPTAILNDLWMYDPATNLWTWMGGSDFAEDTGIYGTQNVPGAANMPGARSGAATWKDAAGNFWLRGGDGNGETSSRGMLADVWKFDFALKQWAWQGGSKTIDTKPTLGTQGVGSVSNNPGGLTDPYTWSDDSGNVWLFGGYGYGTSSSMYADSLNTLWKFNPVTKEWTWVKGSYNNSLFTALAVYGTQGTPAVANTPGGGYGGAHWRDASGNFWIYGGYGYRDAGSDKAKLDDLWRFNPTTSQWTWMAGTANFDAQPVYGTQGTAAATNTPGARYNAVWWRLADGSVVLYSGTMMHTNNVEIEWIDTWRLNPANLQWTWVTGPRAASPVGVYGTLGTAAAGNTPGAREYPMTWTAPDQSLWLFGGKGADANAGLGLLNDMWSYNPSTNQWAWMKGSNQANPDGTYGTMGTPHANNVPGGRRNSARWVDSAGNLWLMGGETTRYISGQLSIFLRNDLWKYDRATNRWTWEKGGRYNQDRGVYGTLGVAADANTPGAREGAATWTDSAGNLWLFGGRGTSESSASPGRLNDLWRFDTATKQWTWMGGSKTFNTRGTYGTVQVAATENVPGSRQNAASWTDNAGNLWLFGGDGYGEGAFVGVLNDLWKYTPAIGQWTWMKGNKLVDVDGVPGAIGVTGAANSPNNRYAAAYWKSSDGSLWLYGGYGQDMGSNWEEPMSDLWKLDPAVNQWTRIAGDSTPSVSAVHGPSGAQDAAYTPGGRYAVGAWSGAGGTAWLFGGSSGFAPEFNDMWKYQQGSGTSPVQDWELY